jgi:hypothetical protein
MNHLPYYREHYFVKEFVQNFGTAYYFETVTPEIL